MSARKYGVHIIANVLFCAPFIVAAYAIQASSLLFTGIYLVIAGINLLIIAKIQASKHSSPNASAAHAVMQEKHKSPTLNSLCKKMSKTQNWVVFMQALNRNAKQYTLAEKAMIGINLLVMIGIPQYWLWQTKTGFALYWGATISTALCLTTKTGKKNKTKNTL